MPNLKPYSLIPADDNKRLEKLYEYEILNTHAEEEFDKIAQLAATIFNCSTAFITFVDVDSVFLKSNISTLTQNEIPRKDSLCSLTILDNEVTLIEDASVYDDLKENPYVNTIGGIRFYAGAPLITSEGYKLGSISVTDDKPRTATMKELGILSDLAKIVIDKLDNRATAKKIIVIQTEYLNRSIHDLKNYIGNLLMATEMLQELNLDETHRDLPEIINRNAHRLSDRMSQMLNLSKIESNVYNLYIEACKISELIDVVVRNYSTMSNGKNQTIIKKYDAGIILNADSKTISQIFENLFSNAIKYSYPFGEITITSEENLDYVVFGVHDNGQGLTTDDLAKMFTRYAKLSSLPTGKESSTGLGMTITKIMVELHNGKIWVESLGKNKGCSFFVSFPKTLLLTTPK